MAGYLVQQGASVLCAHGGPAQPGTTNPRVRVGGAPTVLLGGPWTVTGCPLPPPPGGTGPCVTGAWSTGTVRVRSSGLPLVLQGGSAVCAPTGTPMTVVAAQQRVVAA